jgi:ankyrin repeat protein
VRLVLGRRWDGDANARGGPLDCPPLVYACHSCFETSGVARELLARGADPNGFFVNEYGRMSALYGAAGVKHDPELTRALLESGANPDDGESLYHAAYADSADCVRILLEHGATVNGTNALGAVVDADHVEHLRLMLDAGGDPNESALIAHAVRRGGSAETIELLAGRGADLERKGGETWRGDVPLRTPYQHAVLRNRTDSAEALAALGATTEAAPEDLAVAAAAAGEPASSRLPGELDPDAQEVLILAALRGRLDSVVAAAGVRFSGVVGGSPEGTLLHHAAWMGDPDVVRELLERGADPLAGSPHTPLAWAVHGSQFWDPPGRDHVAVAPLLVIAGAVPDLGMLEAAEGPLYGWLGRRIEPASDT